MQETLDYLIQGKDGLVVTVHLKMPTETLINLGITAVATGTALKLVSVLIDRFLK